MLELDIEKMVAIQKAVNRHEKKIHWEKCYDLTRIAPEVYVNAVMKADTSPIGCREARIWKNYIGGMTMNYKPTRLENI